MARDTLRNQLLLEEHREARVFDGTTCAPFRSKRPLLSRRGRSQSKSDLSGGGIASRFTHSRKLYLPTKLSF
jgi:hypothetical protein